MRDRSHTKYFKQAKLRITLTKEHILHAREQLAPISEQLAKTKARLHEKQMDLARNRRNKRHIKVLNKQIRKARGQKGWYKRQQLLPLLRHILPIYIILVVNICMPREAKAQTLDRLFCDNTQFDSIPTRSLRAELDAVAFFHDNEYSSQLTRGYSLPGARLIPHLAYNPLSNVNIEAGLSMLVFNGANKYPNYAYHDIGTWKGNQYQRGVHALPWIRLQASLKHIDIILGNIYGGSNHRLSPPLFNAEENLSADPEMGVQILLHRKRIQSDTWLNWQSYIFKEDSHQEAFSVGENTDIVWGNTDKRWTCHTPISITIQHRGGEQDTTSLGVQTLSNIAIGLGITGKEISPKIDFLSAWVSALANYQQKGELWPFDMGYALYSGCKMTLLNHLDIGFGYLYSPKQFVTLFGSPFFSTISLRHKDVNYHGIQTSHCSIGYHHSFAKDYVLGAQAELFHEQTRAHNEQPKLNETNFSFGIYFRVSPSFLIKRF